MAFIKCTDCGKVFSDTERACPNCGCPAKDCSVMEPIKPRSENVEKPEKETNRQYTKRSLLSGETIIASAEFQIAPIILLVVTIYVVNLVYFVCL